MEDKTYQAPAIVCEGELEVQAGSPIDSDPLGLDPEAISGQ
jgi:hypothetical protein